VPALITVTDVEVSPDQAHAKVFFTLLGDTQQIADATEGLKRAAGFLRTQLAQRMKLRTIPQLDFKYDASVERGMKLTRLIDEAVGTPRKDPAEE
jgi:ribosome-binding factor A